LSHNCCISHTVQPNNKALNDSIFTKSAAANSECDFLHSATALMSTEMRKSHSVTALMSTPIKKPKFVPRNRKSNGGTCLLLTAIITLFLVYGAITLLILNRGQASRRNEINSINIFQKDHGSSLGTHPHPQLQHNDLSSIFLEGQDKAHQRENMIYQKPTRDWNELSELLKNDPLERVTYLRKRMPVD
jgi:hypothetical protein